MKRLFLLLFFCVSHHAFSQYFEFFVQTTTSNESFTIPTDGSLTYDYNVDVVNPFNPNATVSYTNVTGDLTHTFGPPGSYIIRILDGSVFPRIDFSSSPDRLKITIISRWGNNPWTTMESAFEGCENLILDAPDTPDLSNVISTQRMFRDADALVDNRNRIGTWDMSHVQNMGQMFRNCAVFNEDLSNWDTSSAQTFTRMFQGASAFDQNLGNWNISNLTSNGTDAIFAQAGVSTSNYDQTVTGWGTRNTGEPPLPTGLNIRFDNSTYCTSQAIRTTLANSPTNWNFIDSGLDCSNLSDESFFITTWETTTANESITIPTAGSGYGYYIDWGDGQIQNGITGSISHSYSNVGTHTVKIVGQFPRIFFNDTGDKLKIKSIDQWGGIIWQDMFNAFDGCENLVYNATDAPNLSNVTSLDRMFNQCKNFNATNLNNWDLSTVESVTFMFNEAEKFNGNISNWDVSNIVDFRNMFSSARDFNSDISGWTINTNESVNMEGMFAGASDFNQSIGNWNISQVTDVGFMFEDALNFNQSLGNWDISNVTDIGFMLNNSDLSLENYDATLIGWATLDIGEAQIPNDLNLGATGLQYCSALEERGSLQLNNNWTFSDAGTNCPEEDKLIMVWKTTSNNENIRFQTTGSGNFFNIEWGDGTVTNDATGNEQHTYAQAGTYEVKLTGSVRLRYNNLPAGTSTRLKLYEIKQWGANQWTSTADAFYGCENLTITATDIPDLSQVTNMSDMFRNCFSLEDVGGQMGAWDVSTVENFNTMFQNTTTFNTSLGAWDLSNATNLGNMLNNSGLTSNSYDSTLIGWRNNPNTPSNLNLGASGLTYCNAINEHNYLDNDLNWSLNDAGINCSDNDKFITTWLTTSDNESITIPTIGGNYNYSVDWGDGTNDSDITGNISHVYASAGTYTIKISGSFPRIHFNHAGFSYKIRSIDNWGTIQWTSMENAFRGCSNLSVLASDAPDLTNVTVMDFMFVNCNSLTTPDLSNWDVSNVTQVNSMFAGSGNFNGDITTWDVGSIINFSSMFLNAQAFNQDISSWNIGERVTESVSIGSMFRNAFSFDQNIGSWDISEVSNMGNIFNNSGMSIENYDATLIDWATLDTGETQIPMNINLGAAGVNYCQSEIERQNLIDTYNWNITGDNLSCGLKIAPKVYLQGAVLNPYADEESLMRDDLHRENVIPITSPYADGVSLDPGIFSVLDHNALVDWVWVELRDASDNTTIIASQSALLQRDGDVLDSQYQTLTFDGIESGDYYVAIRHRNHLGILTASTISLSATVTNLDLSTDVNAVIGGSLALSDMGNGIFAMYAGDTTGDGNILNTDISNAINASGGIDVYSGADANMDGNILNTDIQLIIQPNAGRIQQF